MKTTTSAQKRGTVIWLAAIAVLALGASVAQAVPVDFDGDIDGSDLYPIRLEDPEEGIFGSDGFDIDGVEFARDTGWFYIGVDTVGDFDPNGGAAGFPAETEFLFRIDDGNTTMLFTLVSDDFGISMSLAGGSLAGADWDAKIGTDLEIRISNTLLAGFDHTSFFFLARLDNIDMDPDDIIAGSVVGVPEPAALSLVATGSLLVFLKKRRRAAA